MRDFRIKVCGITRPDDALMAVETGVDALGFNFSRGSKRSIAPSDAAAIVAEVRRHRPETVCVGVFVEQSVAEAQQVAAQVDLDRLQLHGDHVLSDVPEELHRPILWVTRLPPAPPGPTAERLARTAWAVANAAANARREGDATGKFSGLLVDAYSPHDYGGTGQTLAWEPLGQRQAWVQLGWSTANWPAQLPLILAGGLNPENVARAIREARPDAIDVASGVEQSPGIKSESRVRALVAAAEQAWQELGIDPSESMAGPCEAGSKPRSLERADGQ